MGLLSLLLAIFFIYASTSTFASIVEKDTLTPFQRFKDGQTLVSANRRFVLGFFSPFSQTTKRYLGIWYKDITPLTVVWVANRTKPLKNFDAALMLYFNGSLALQDQACNLVLLVMPELISSTKMDKFEIWFSDILSLIAIGMALLAFIVVCIFSKIKCVKRQVKHESNSSRDSNGTQEENPEVKLFDIDLISTATNNFASDNKIGEGGFGPVFKGELPSGQLVAVKRLSRNSQQGLEEFGNEASLIARLQHRNLVKLFGGCVHEDERMLVYEYLPNESLNKFIFDEARKRLLPWAKRFNIFIGVAKGLVYLHDDSRLRVVHRDLKASNILLDSEMMPKISDFGLAKILEGENMLEEPSVRVNGTHGYMSPEYVLHGQISTKLDVFSFGILILETISGMRNWGFLHPDHDLNLLGHVCDEEG
ncbi:G-type lectin S-receptor-like serine/threonine-protein kinase At4g27290 [Camellia sinensis]|uniref:G-type lectin S-receptor-like serine/threonine-protein kinase At4g27290 n=1 Tax=Camellia sinensis TaxID=4442 RepID=UPI0010360CCD|nr:G-type lectin S-receptor-like serine/threonine-protein kinase At4g27290 [Camellia sinensis]